VYAESGRGLVALAAAMDSIKTLTIDPEDQARLSVAVFGNALTEVLRDGPREDVRIAGLPAVEPALRDGLEASYRRLAGFATSREERIALVDQANAARRWTVR
jgi:serine/threonine-protein kinase PknG